MRSGTVTGAITLAAALLGGGAALAGVFEVSPVRVTLTPAAKSGLLEVTNKGDVDARFQVKVYTWREPPVGEMQLADTKELVVFPTMFNLKPGQTRKLRVAAQVGFAAAEGSFRVIVEELPAPKKASAASAVSMLMRMSIPVFLASDAQEPKPQITEVAAAASALTFVLKNAGTRHYMAKVIRVVGLRGSERVAPTEVAGWYVLPGGVRNHRVPLTPELCAEKKLLVEVETEERTISVPLDLPPAACAK